MREHIRARVRTETLPESPRYLQEQAAGRRTRTRRSARRTSTFRPRRVAHARRARGGEALPPDLGALRRLADDAGRLRRDVGGDRGGHGGLPRLRLDAEVRRVPRAPTASRPKRRTSRQGETARQAAAADAGGDADAPLRDAREEGDAASAALQRGLARQVSGRERHRPPLDVRRDPAQDRAARVRAQEGPALHADGARAHGHRDADPVLRRLLRDLLHGADGGGAWTTSKTERSRGARRSPSSTRRSRGTATARSPTWCRARPASRSTRRARSSRFPVAPEIDREVPQVRQEAEAPHGQERPLHRRAAGIPAAPSRRTSPTRTKTSMDATELENTTCEECGSPMKLRAEPHGLDVPRLHGVSRSAATSSTSSWPAARPRRGPTSRPARCARESGHPARPAARPLRRLRRLQRATRPASTSRPSPSRTRACVCPKDGGVIAERRGRFRPFYGCVNYPGLRLHALGAPDPGGVPAVRQPVPAPAREKGGNVLACDKGLRLREAGGQAPRDEGSLSRLRSRGRPAACRPQEKPAPRRRAS